MGGECLKKKGELREKRRSRGGIIVKDTQDKVLCNRNSLNQGLHEGVGGGGNEKKGGEYHSSQGLKTFFLVWGGGKENKVIKKNKQCENKRGAQRA